MKQKKKLHLKTTFSKEVSFNCKILKSFWEDFKAPFRGFSFYVCQLRRMIHDSNVVHVRNVNLSTF